jgi:hypothetical protein
MNADIVKEILPPLPETPKLEEVVEKVKDVIEDAVKDASPAVETLKLRVLKEFKACCLIA